MSSHHIIREKQEPALFILNNDHFREDDLGQLLEWSPTVIVTSENYELADSWGIKIDAVVAPANFQLSQPAVKIIPKTGDGLYDGLNYLVAENYPAVNILAGVFHPDAYGPFIARINLVIYLPGQKVFPASSGFSKWKAQGEQITFFELPPHLNTSGLVPVSATVYQTIADGFYSLSFSGPAIFIGESI